MSDTQRREPGCQCHQEIGDSPCRVHGDGPEEEYMVLVSGGPVYVKERSFFESQGGHVEDWGRRWVRVVATSIEHARRLGCDLPGAWPYERQAKP